MRRYGLLPDHRTDHEEYACGSVAIAPESDLRHLFPPILNQENIGDCTEASGVAIRYALAKKANTPNVPVFDPIPPYVWERQHDGTFPSDAGSRLSTTAYIAETIGFPPLQGAYNPAIYNDVPAQAVQTEAAMWKIKNAVRLTSLDAILESLSMGIPPHLGILIYESFEWFTTMRDGVVPMPGPSEKCLGCHAIVGAGHSMAKQIVTIRNSWGAQVGKQGYFDIPIDYFRSSRTFMSAWQWVV